MLLDVLENYNNKIMNVLTFVGSKASLCPRISSGCGKEVIYAAAF